ncbi:hypothetical protein CIL02_14595 [Prevotella sp. P3-122]|nr:hypothetical protein CIL02_14595 [Prevotella sp. P3-122]
MESLSSLFSLRIGLTMSCKALREQMQSFAWAVAKLCVGGCKALRERWAKLEDSLAIITAGDVWFGNQKR